MTNLPLLALKAKFAASTLMRVACESENAQVARLPKLLQTFAEITAELEGMVYPVELPENAAVTENGE